MNEDKNLQKSKIKNNRLARSTKRGEEIVGVISDTHGLLRLEAMRALKNSDRIIHGGDIGGPEILAALQTIAPLIAVRGNNDREAWADSIPTTQTITILKQKIFVIHNLQEMDFDPATRQISIVISGHSHQPRKAEWRSILKSRKRRSAQVPTADRGSASAHQQKRCPSPHSDVGLELQLK